MDSKLVYWEMRNGHKHSFLSNSNHPFAEDNVPSIPFQNSKRIVKTQKDYLEFVRLNEHTEVSNVVIMDYNDINEFIDRGYAKFMNNENDIDGLEFI